MNSSSVILGFLLSLLLSGLTEPHFTNEWAVKMAVSPKEAEEFARKNGFHYVDEVFDGVYHFKHHSVSKRSLVPNVDHHQSLMNHPQVEWAEQQKVLTRVKRDFFTDPLWPKQWYLNRGENLDMNVLMAYKRFGATGEGVVVTILDDGVEKNHTDLHENYDPKASYDFNDSDDDPHPRYDFTDFNRHGTRCAGEVAAVANNDKCGVGIAYKAKIGGIRILDGDVTDMLEARSLVFRNDYIHIYSASWGPTDNGKTLDGPGKLTSLALEKSIKEGRGRLGSLFVWASGNGGRDGDDCNCDGYAGLIYTISISSASEGGSSPYYSERCSSTIATTYSSGHFGDRQIVTTDLHNLCTTSHTGTSASAPLAAGIIALALQVNPDLTWRDVQHLIVRSSHKANLQSEDWVLNGAGRLVSHKFGYGLMDAGKISELAQDWKTVPVQQKCIVQVNFQPVLVSIGNTTHLEVDVNGCQGTENEINYLEHVVSYVTFTSTNRGQTEILLTSPNGTASELVRVRPKDTSSEGFNEWPFMSTHHWGEQPGGKWHLSVRCNLCIGTIKAWKLEFFGTKSDPSPSLEKPRDLDKNEKMCADHEFFLDDSCYERCPAFHFPSRGLVNVTSYPDGFDEILNSSTCSPCHYTCKYCSGPNKYNCTSCPDELSLSPDKQCLNPDKGIVYPDIYILAAIFLAVTVASVIISIAVAGLLSKYHRRSFNQDEQNEPLLGES